MLAGWSFKSFGRRLTTRPERLSKVRPRATLSPSSFDRLAQLHFNSLSPKRYISDFLKALNRP
jgi:hypothetical protein